jgi:adenosine kinase
LPSPAEVAISGSIAYDYIMAFGGSFADHIIPEKTHVISVSFLVESLRKQRGGVAGNIAYSLALLGSSSELVGAVGGDFGPYRQEFDALGIGLDHVLELNQYLSASAFMMADQTNNQIASFYPGPSAHTKTIDVTSLGNRSRFAIVGATDPEVMRLHTEQFGTASCNLIYDPAFQIILLSGKDLRRGIDLAWCVVGNDYEFAMIERKTGLTVDAIADCTELVVVTYGESGSELIRGGAHFMAPSARVSKVLDPTGAGDAFRAGLIKGLLLDLPLEITGRLANLAAAYVVEKVGTQEHYYTPFEFVQRFNQAFPDFRGAIDPEGLTGSPSIFANIEVESARAV